MFHSAVFSLLRFCRNAFEWNFWYQPAKCFQAMSCEFEGSSAKKTGGYLPSETETDKAEIVDRSNCSIGKPISFTNAMFVAI